MSDNPRQFSSLDDRGMGSSLTNRPTTGSPAVSPIDFAEHMAVSDAVIRAQKQKGTYVERSSAGERAYEAEQKAARDAAFRETAQKAKAEQELQAQRTQARNLELQRIRNSENTPHPYELESERATARRLMGLPPVDEPPATAASTASRQPPPSKASPPPTPNGTAARASPLVEPTAHPAPAILKEAVAPIAIGGALASLPRSLPQAAGRLVIPGVAAGLILGQRVISGQSLTQAVSGTAATLIGGVAGGLIGTAIGGPIGGVVGNMIGGFAGGLFSDWLMSQNIPTTAARQEAHTPNYVDTRKGQTIGAMYLVTFSWEQFFNGQSRGTQYGEFVVRGPIRAIALGVPPGLSSVGGYVIGTNVDGSDDVKNVSFGYAPASEAKSLSNLSVTRVDGNPEIYPDTTPPATGFDNKPYYYGTSPLGNDATIPSGKPAAGQKKGKADYVPSSMPANNTPNGGGAFPNHGGLAPSYLPNPEHIPSNGGEMLPDYAPQPQSPPFLEPQDTPIARETPRNGVTITQSTGGVVPIKYAEVTPATITQSTITRSEGTDALGNYIPPNSQLPISSFSVPTSTPQTKKASPTPDAYSPVPKAQLQPAVKTSEQATTDKTSELIKEQKKDFDDQIGRLTAIATGIAALTPAIQGIPDAIANNPNVRAANRDDVQGAVCEISQPTGCLGAPIKQAEDAAKANGNKLNDILTGLNTAGSAAQLALLETINGKLGAQLPGGLSGTFGRLWQTLQVDRVLNILTLITTFHNAAMLSNNIIQTLFSGIDNLGQAAGFKWKNEEGNETGFGGIISEWTGNFFKSIFGATTLQNINTTWNAANRTYQSITNALWNIQGMFDSLRSVGELAASYTGKIGNALKRAGTLFENAFPDMTEVITARTAQQAKWDAVLQNVQPVENVVSAFSQVTGEIVSIGDNFNELKNQRDEFLASKTAGETAVTQLIAGEKAAAQVNQPINSTDVQKND